MKGNAKKSTRTIAIGLEKKGKKEGKNVWKELARRIMRPSRKKAEVNVYKLDMLAGKNEGKIFVVPGKVLSKGSIAHKIEVACLACSEKARQKIMGAKGKVMTLNQLIEESPGADKMVIIE